jgi:hypothetical protein
MFSSRAKSLLGKLDRTEDLVFDRLLEQHRNMQQFAKVQKEQMTSYLEKSRAMCYASISSAEAFGKFFSSAASVANTDAAPQASPLYVTLQRGHHGFGMGIEENGMVSGFTGVGGPAELAGVAPGMQIVGVNGMAVSCKSEILMALQQGSQQLEANFALRTVAPSPRTSSSTNQFQQCAQVVSESTESYARDIRGEQEQKLITEVLDPLDAYIGRLGALKTVIAERESAREKLDRYRDKVRTLGESGSGRDPSKLPRNEQKMAAAMADYDKVNAAAIRDLRGFHSESITFFAGLQRAFLQHQVALYSRGSSTFELLLDMVDTSLRGTSVPLEPTSTIAASTAPVPAPAPAPAPTPAPTPAILHATAVSDEPPPPYQAPMHPPASAPPPYQAPMHPATAPPPYDSGGPAPTPFAAGEDPFASQSSGAARDWVTFN